MDQDLTITHLVAAAAIILVAANGAGWLARRLGQPSIVGQLVAGIALGPSLLSQLPAVVGRTLFPPAIAPMLTALSQIGLVIFLYFVGYELDLRVLRGRTRLSLTVVAAAFALPMAVGAAAALTFHHTLQRLGLPQHASTGSVLFLAVTLTITAVPVLVVVVRENGLAGTVPGVVAVSAAGLIDVLSWTVLVAALLSGGHHQGMSMPVRLALLLLTVAVMIWPGRPLLRRLLRSTTLAPALRLGVLLGFACAAAWATSALGLHVIFGALLAGAVTPREPDGTLDPDLIRSLEGLGPLLLPFFFVVSGRGVVVGSLNGTAVLVLVVVTVLAVVVKVGGGAGAARACGLDAHDSLQIGVLLSTRGLTELIALNAGLQAGLLSGRLYTVLVLMAIATTLLTQPLLKLVGRAPAAGTGSPGAGTPRPAAVPEAR